MSRAIQGVERSKFGYYKINSGSCYSLLNNTHAERQTDSLGHQRPIQCPLTQTDLGKFPSLACTVNSFRVPTRTQSINMSEAQEPTDQCCPGTVDHYPAPEIIKHPCYINKSPFFSIHLISDQYMDHHPPIEPHTTYQGPDREVNRGSILHLLL